MKKKPAFPNDTFNSQEAYFKFCDKYKVYGNDAYALRKKMDKQVIPMPRIKPCK